MFSLRKNDINPSSSKLRSITVVNPPKLLTDQENTYNYNIKKTILDVKLPKEKVISNSCNSIKNLFSVLLLFFTFLFNQINFILNFIYFIMNHCE